MEHSIFLSWYLNMHSQGSKWAKNNGDEKIALFYFFSIKA